MEPKLAQLPDDEASDELREKQHFLKGVLDWDLRRDYKARLWAEKKNLGELDRQLREAQRRHHEVSSARDDWPEKFAALTRADRRAAAARAGYADCQRKRRSTSSATFCKKSRSTS